jgi:hypothetical protein
MDYELSSARREPISRADGLGGRFVAIGGAELDLSNSNDRPTVIVFGQDTCSECAAEADSLRASLSDPTRSPELVHVYTVLVGATLEDAGYWHQDHPVPWTVGIDDDSSTLFGRYCAERTVPCVVVHVPGSGVVLSRNGRVSFAELTALTGPWESR